ncbi:MAG: trypsin-like peptidase domain-containing protein [Okeania sp. SIO2C2]|uniref:S1 family peptidase n=1 Tax=Okeania sp. SIO2C2 TaxID=2607787 RepID=UPI0013B78BDA|nr:serine protease [Okeania sp. SIO2C2]NEP87357.1 trypsin-like peptidase domain-containing protein [Okeania sp. SIO2C2]
MIKKRHIFTASLTGIILSIGKGVDAVPRKLTVEEINSISKQTTVLIAPRLSEREKDDLLKRKPVARWTVGSGVIIAKQDKTYYILTVTHNFSQEQVSQDAHYGILTSDKKVHQVTKINDGRECTNRFLEAIKNKKVETALVRFGCFNNQEINGYDLAIVSFESKKNYPVVTLGDASKLQEEDIVYISGWPKIEAEPKLKLDGTMQLDSQGKIICKDPAPERQRHLAWGPLKASIPVTEKDNGYSLYYTDYTRPGMSGGPVFNSGGELVGIHGRGSTNKPICGQIYEPISNNNSTSKNKFEAENNSDPFNVFESENTRLKNEDQKRQDDFLGYPEFESKNNLENGSNKNQNNSTLDLDYTSKSIYDLQKMYSSAQNVNYSRKLIQEIEMNLSFKLEAPSQRIIQSEITKIPQIKIPGVSSQIENSMSINSDITILENPELITPNQTPELIDPNQTKEGGFEDPNDKIDNIYEIFNFDLETRIRDKKPDLL